MQAVMNILAGLPAWVSGRQQGENRYALNGNRGGWGNSRRGSGASRQKEGRKPSGQRGDSICWFQPDGTTGGVKDIETISRIPSP